MLIFLGLMKSCLFNKKNEKGFLNDIDLSNYFRLRLLKISIEEKNCVHLPKNIFIR